MVPVQIRDNGRLIQFKSRTIFLRMIGKSEAYLYTRHFKETNQGITFQQLWDRDNVGHINLERHIAKQKPLVTDEGVMAYDGDHILISPISLIPSNQPASAPVASSTITSHPVFDTIVHFFIDKAIELYVAGYKSDAAMEAHVLYDSIRALQLDEAQQHVISINNDPGHELVSMLNSYLRA